MNQGAQFGLQGSYKYSSSSGSNVPTWRFDDAESWELRKCPCPEWTLPDRARLILRHWEDLKRVLAGVRTYDLPEPTFLRWLSRACGAAPPPQVTQGVSVMLNHIVTDGTVEPFKILATFVKKHLTVEMKKLPSGSPCWFYLKLDSEFTHLEEYLLMIPEWFFVIRPPTPENGNTYNIELKSEKDYDGVLRRVEAVRILHEYSVLRYQHKADTLEVQLRDQVTLVPYHKGRICGCLPIPGKASREKWKGSEPVSVLTPEVVVASPNVSETLEALTKIWQDRFAKSVLISAPPGSGKEAYAGSIPFGNGRGGDGLLSLPLASGNTASLERQLFGRRREDGSIEEGLIAKASNTALFLDEVHQPENEAGIRASLLRPLESEEYFPSQSNRAERVENVLFVLATSKTLKELNSIQPTDFWTRMTHVVTVKHPLDYDEDHPGFPKWTLVLECFFKCFWWDRLEKFFKVDPSLLNGDAEHAATWLKEEQIELLLEETALNNISSEFAASLLAILTREQLHPRSFSVRGIRSIVSRMFSTAASDIARGHSDCWQRNFKEGLDAVIKDILQVAKFHDAKSRP